MLLQQVLSSAVLAAVLIGITGCQAEQDIPVPPVGELPASYAPYYAELKHAPAASEQYQTALFAELAKRSAVADYIAETQIKDAPQLQLEWLEMRNELLIKHYFDQFMQTSITEETLNKYYNEHPQQFIETCFRAAYLLIPANNKAKANPLTAAGRMAQQLRSGATLLDAMASYKKTSGRSARIGELKLRESDAALKPLFAAAGKLAAGSVSEPVSTERGVYVLRLMEGPLSEPRPFLEVRELIREQLAREYQQAEMQRLLKLSDYDGD
jgi:parvulin-like peptidyl-prolyl isomerase